MGMRQTAVAVVVAVLLCVAARADTPAQVTEIFTQLMTSQFHSHPQEWLRQAHAKQHGCLRVEVDVAPTLPPSLAAGVFEAGRRYPAFLRFSNGVGRGFAAPPVVANESDAVPDTRGLALKLFNVSGSFVMPSNASQAFTFTTSRNGFLATPSLALGFFAAVQKGAVALTEFLALHPSVAKGFAGLGVHGAITNLLTATYYTAPAQLHGSTPAKYRIAPCAATAARLGAISGPHPRRIDSNYLTDNLIRDIYQQLAPDRDVCLEWSVQLYADPQSTPINDTTVAWPTPYHSLAQIRIPRQYVWDAGKLAFCRHMSFNPWLSIEQHKPLGFLQDIRRDVYTAMAEQRRMLRGQSEAFVNYDDYLRYPDL